LFEDLELTDDTAGLKEIDQKKLKRHYRELSVKYHPDKSPESAQRFNRIRDAYEILSDPVKVVLYDTGGPELVKKFEKGRSELEATNNAELSLSLTLAQIYTGHTEHLKTTRQVVCRSCRLNPHLPRCAQCRRCPGEMKQEQIWMDQMHYRIEEKEIPSKEKCARSTEEVIVNVERGQLHGDVIQFPYMADQRPGSHIPGDLRVSIKVMQDPRYKRAGDNLLVTIHISLYEALLGFQRELRHLDGHKVRFGVKRGTVLQPGYAMVIDGEGMPLREDPSSFGQLIIRFEIDFPRSLPTDQDIGDKLESALRGVGIQPSQGSSTGAKGRNEL
jgi:DnaJ-class molecular chaperone